MNANELSDVLEDLHEQDKIDGVAHLAMPEAADMLRQQQVRIDQLLETQDYLYKKMTKYELRHAEQRKRIEELETKTLTNEEIYEVWKKAMQEEAKIEYSIYATQLERQPFIYFARAILRKAQEK